MADSLDVKLNGAADLMQLLGELPKRLRDKALAQAVMAGGGPIKQAMQANAPQSSGLLKKSIKIRRKKYRGGEVAVAIVGPARGMKTTVAAVESGKNRGAIKKSTRRGIGMVAAYGSGAAYRDPAKYAHLVERGRKEIRPKKAKALYNRLGNRVFGKAQATKGTGFAARAVAAAKTQGMAAMQEKLAEVLASEAASLAGKGGG